MTDVNTIIRELVKIEEFRNPVGGESKEVVLYSNDLFIIGVRIFMPKVGDLIRLFLEESHCSSYSIHLGPTKMNCDQRQHY